MTREELHTLFVYETDTGRLRKLGKGKPYPWRGIGSKRQYLATTIHGKTYYAHRLVWFYHHGVFPKMLDHIDRDTRNNRIENLRECTPAQNQYNVGKRGHNRSGYKGVAFCPKSANPWRARIIVDKKVVELGYYAEPETAAKAYAEAAVIYAGTFARTD